MTLVDQLDLVDEMQWEDVVDFETLESTGLVEDMDDEPSYGYHTGAGSNGSIYSYTDWFYDHDQSAFSIL
jgi:hypothetical protein